MNINISLSEFKKKHNSYIINNKINNLYNYWSKYLGQKPEIDFKQTDNENK